ncbi:unnamed protein product [Schistosoma rodhaini]|uniref:Ubiquitin carboxyl-terminal hydrolase n=1 Tax=Schistosoma rodhaini TaxID=6188 RepID=A0AA85GFL7_9TREM|nr:unnamed protein product [Schistosoma rodhaini]
MGKKNKNRRELCQTSDNTGDKVNFRNNVKENVPVKGLHNLGNTCYLNAALQCLARSPWLLNLLVVDESRESSLTKPNGDSLCTLCVSLPLMKCPLTTQFKELISVLKPGELPNTKMNSSNAISPGMFRNVFIERCPRFSGFRQHDSHELIRALLDCLKQEELSRWKKGILLKLNVNPKDVRDDEKESIRSWGKAASIATIVDRLFGGILVSTIQCCCCGTVRPKFEPFLDLSLSVSETNVSKRNINESVSKQHSKGASSSKQLRKKERKRKAPKQRKRQNFIHDYQSDQGCLDQCSSDSDSQKTKHNHQPLDTFIAKCCADVTDPNVDSKHVENVDGDLVVNEHQHEDNNGNNDVNLLNSNECELSSETLNQGSCDEVASSDDVEGSDRYDSVVSLQVIPNGCDGNVKQSEINHINTELEKLSLNTVVSSQLFSCDSDELNQAIHYARVPLGQNRSNNSTEEGVTSIYECLSKYTSAELLTGSNRLICDVCTKQKSLDELDNNLDSESMDKQTSNNNKPDILQDAIKRDLIYKPPPILTIHLKRFQQVGFQLRKSQKRIHFPIYLDITPFCSVLAVTRSNQIRYRLYGVIEHTGHLTSGHYVAYVSVPKSYTNCNDNESDLMENQFIGPLNRSPKWPLSVNDLIQRLRRCDHHQLLLSSNNFMSYSIQNDTNSLVCSNNDGNNTINHSTNHNHEVVNDDDHDDDHDDSRQWFYCSDSHVTRVSQSTVLNCQAYVLFYERIE